ncbi:MAG: hypothetical protein ABW123_04595, partial [Cystobacter sp.]
MDRFLLGPEVISAAARIVWGSLGQRFRDTPLFVGPGTGLAPRCISGVALKKPGGQGAGRPLRISESLEAS